MKNFRVLLDKLAQRPPRLDARVRVFKLEANPDRLENLPAPERLTATNSQAAQPGHPALERKRRPSS